MNLIEELTALEEKATKGPWERDSDGKYDSHAQEHYVEHFLTGGKDRIVSRTHRHDAQEWTAGCHGVFDDLQARNDLNYIAALRNAFPALKREREELIGALRPFAAMRLSTEWDSVIPEPSKELRELLEWRDKPIMEARALLSRVTKG